MDLRNADETTQLKETIDRALSRVNTTIPGLVEAFDEDTQTVTVIPSIQMRVVIDDIISFVDLPTIRCPLIFPFASVAGFALTLPVRKGDPCIILFSQRSIDNWVERGGIQPPETGVSSRHHDLSDGLAILAAAPLNHVLGAWETEGIELRNRDKSSRITVRDENIEVVRGESSVILTDEQIQSKIKGSTVTLTEDSITSKIGDTTSILKEGEIEHDGGTGNLKGCVQGDCLCAFTGKPHPMVSSNVRSSL